MAYITPCTYIILFVVFAFADLPLLYNNEDYNKGYFGSYPVDSYASGRSVSPRLNQIVPLSNCDDSSHIFLGPHGDQVEPPGPVILSPDGSLVWTSTEYGSVFDFRMQEYSGTPYLTFWTGKEEPSGVRNGEYIMLDQHYHEFRRFRAGRGLSGDVHEFKITQEGTALITIYNLTQADLSSVESLPKESGYVLDGIFQEIDIETGEVLFEWNSSDHFHFSDTIAVMGNGTWNSPLDWFHINSVDKDKYGNYLVSSRYLYMVACIDGNDGHVIWRLGGKRNSFRDLSGGTATNFTGQHDARWTRDYASVTLFDNGADWTRKASNKSIGKRISLDVNTMTARVEQTYTNPANILSFSQGSFQTLPNGEVFIGFGINGAFTQFYENGTVKCDAYFGPAEDFGSGNVQSYRNLRFNWTGLPKTLPSLIIREDIAYVSWLGSTQVRTWTIQNAKKANRRFGDILYQKKEGFETEFILKGRKSLQGYIRAVAKDVNGHILGFSSIVHIRPNPMQITMLDEASQLGKDFGIFSIITGVIIVLTLIATAYHLVRYLKAYHQSSQQASDLQSLLA